MSILYFLRARLLGKKVEETLTSESKSTTSDSTSLILNKEEDDDAVVIESVSRSEKTHFHFDGKPFIEDVEISETPEMVIVDKLHSHPVYDAVEQQTLTLAEDSQVLGSPELPDKNENSQRQQPDALESNHTTQDTICLDITDLVYHTAYVDDISDEEEAENTPELIGTYADVEDRVDTQDSANATEDVPDSNDMIQPSCSLCQVPPVMVAEKLQETENRAEFTADVESYVSSDVTFTAVGMVTEDAVLIPDDFNMEEKIQIADFHPYFEIATGEDLDQISPPYTLAPESQEAVQAVPNKATTGQREADCDSVDTRLARTHRQDITSSVVFENTQTDVSLIRDILHIVNEMEDISRIITLPANDCNVTISKGSELQSSTPPRWGSIYSTSTRHKSRDPEAAWGANEVHTSIKASSVIREQFKKVAVTAKKYQKKIAYVAVLMLLVLNIGVLAVLLVT